MDNIRRLYYTISEVARELGVYTSKIRYWVKDHRIKTKRFRNGDRKFTPEQLTRLLRIKELREMGTPALLRHTMDLEDQNSTIRDGLELFQRRAEME